MLIIQKGRCPKCGSEFGPLETIQSTHVECSKCKKEVIVCHACKEKGCECGGKYLDAWDKYPNLMH